MTRQETLQAYDVNERGTITSPGKFEGEPIFAPHFWECGLEGFSDADNGSEYTFKFKRGDKELAEWPELKAWLGRARTLRMFEDSQGLVRCH